MIVRLFFLFCFAALQIRPGIVPSAATLFSIFSMVSRVGSRSQVYIKDFHAFALVSRSTQLNGSRFVASIQYIIRRSK